MSFYFWVPSYFNFWPKIEICREQKIKKRFSAHFIHECNKKVFEKILKIEGGYTI